MKRRMTDRTMSPSDLFEDYRSGYTCQRDPASTERITRMSAEWRGAYKNAGRGIGQYALQVTMPQSPSHRASAAVGGLARIVLGFLAPMALAGFLFGAHDAYAHHDVAAVAGEKLFVALDDALVNGLHDVARRVVSSPDVLGFLDAATRGTAGVMAGLVAQAAACGATAMGLFLDLLHLV
jgi:hypothetical protein